MHGYFSYLKSKLAYSVVVTPRDFGEYYHLNYNGSVPTSQRAHPAHIPADAYWYLELDDGRVFVNRPTLPDTVSQGVLLETLESVLL